MSQKLFQYEVGRKSEEYFDPSPYCPSRKATFMSATFNLVSTIIGGGVLSLPYAIDKCGVVAGGVFMMIAAIASDFSLYLLVSCSRRCGASSYEEIVCKAFGKKAQVVTMVLLILLTFLTFVAYIILTKDMTSALMERYVFNMDLSERGKNIVTLLFLCMISPILFFRSINALRFTSIFSLLSILVLAIAMSIRAMQSFPRDEIQRESLPGIKLFANTWSDQIYAFPIISIAYLCHFNVLPVYVELQQPTRQRLLKVVHSTMFSTWIFYLIVGTMGYLYAYQQPIGIQDDILNNFSHHDDLINLGRVGLAITVLLSLPLLFLPCRSTIHRLITLVSTFKAQNLHKQQNAILNKNALHEHTPLLSPARPPSTMYHIILTVSILTISICIAFSLPGVAVVWSIMGSTVGILIAYVIPTISYLTIRTQKPFTDLRKVSATILFLASLFAFTICTYQALHSLFL